MADLEKAVLAAIDATGALEDTGPFAEAHATDNATIVGLIKSLESAEMITVTDIPHSRNVLTAEAQTFLAAGATPEMVVFQAVPPGPGGMPLDALKSAFADRAALFDIGFKQAMAKRWIGTDKKAAGGPSVVRKCESVTDEALQQLTAVGRGEAIADDALASLKGKRKLVALEQWKTYRLTKGPAFALERIKPATDLTAEMLASGEWKDKAFKTYNFQALGLALPGGHLHPLLKVRTQFRKIFTTMGFTEMPTNNYVESSFWNFDALFQPQQHPARDAHDTFFLTKPAITTRFPPEYLERVRAMHERGGFGSVGYGYNWKLAESQKNLLRTHTTAVSSRMLYKLAQEGFKPAKYFSVDRVFRNEAIDRTHLAEFHQIEGLVCDEGLTLGDLIGTLREFFDRLGLTQLRFKPAYNPYTEPSMEIFSYSNELGKWIEVGNSGMFRPEMLRPMGMPENVNVIAWGLSLERPTMILYGIDNIRDLFGHKVSLSMVKRNPVCRLGL